MLSHMTFPASVTIEWFHVIWSFVQIESYSMYLFVSGQLHSTYCLFSCSSIWCNFLLSNFLERKFSSVCIYHTLLFEIEIQLIYSFVFQGYSSEIHIYIYEYEYAYHIYTNLFQILFRYRLPQGVAYNSRWIFTVYLFCIQQCAYANPRLLTYPSFYFPFGNQVLVCYMYHNVFIDLVSKLYFSN